MVLALSATAATLGLIAVFFVLFPVLVQGVLAFIAAQVLGEKAENDEYAARAPHARHAPGSRMARPVAVVTGAAQGIGLEAARHLAATHDVALLDLDGDGARAAAATLPGRGAGPGVRHHGSRRARGRGERCPRAPTAAPTSSSPTRAWR